MASASAAVLSLLVVASSPLLFVVVVASVVVVVGSSDGGSVPLAVVVAVGQIGRNTATLAAGIDAGGGRGGEMIISTTPTTVF